MIRHLTVLSLYGSNLDAETIELSVDYGGFLKIFHGLQVAIVSGHIIFTSQLLSGELASSLIACVVCLCLDLQAVCPFI